MTVFSCFIFGLSSAYPRLIGKAKMRTKQTTDYMYRKNKSLQWRNREIYANFCAHHRNGLPIMDIYATLGNQYDLSEPRIREIVAEQAKMH